MRHSPIASQALTPVVVCPALSPKQCVENILSCLDQHDDRVIDLPHRSFEIRKALSPLAELKPSSIRPPSPPYPRSHDTLSATLLNIRRPLRWLTESYVDGAISPSDPAMSLNYKTKNEDGVLSRLFMSDHASACNVWQLGVLVAKVLLAMLEEDDSDTSTLEVEIETCIMVLLSIALQPHVANGVITRVINHPPTGIDELDHLVDRAQKVLIAKMRPPTPSSRTSSPASRPKAISSAPPSPYLERSQFITEKATRPRGMSRSSTWSAPTTNTAGSMMSKSAAASAVVTSEELTPSGSFVPTRSAFCSLRSMTSDSPRRRGRLPFKWFQRSSSPSPQRSSSVETRASSVPSFSRTSSPDSLSTTATSVAPDSPVPVMLNVPQAEKQRKRRDSVLKEVEDTSPLNTSCCCASCGKRGANFPRCPRCSETWCSRDCRVRSSGGAKHVCGRPTPV